MPICVTGMHRSGTSMVARVLQVSGLYLGEEDELFAGRPDNPEGFFENRRFYAINDRILEIFGSTWDVPKAFPENWQDDPRLDPIYADAKKLVEEFDTHGQWAWKDPRSSLTLALWKKLVPGLKIVVCLRNPVDVCESLTKRGYSSQQFGLDLWETYMRAIEREATQENSIVTHYASYFKDPEAEIRRVVDFCGISATEQKITAAAETIDRKLRHSDSGICDLVSTKADLQLVRLYFEACLRSGPTFENVLRQESITITQAQQEVVEAHRHLEMEGQRFADVIKYKDLEIEAIRKAKDDEIELRQSSLLAELHRNIEESRERMMSVITTKDATINGMQHYIDETEAALRTRVADLETALHSTASQLHTVTSSKAWRIASRLESLYRSIVPARPAPAPQQPPAAISAPEPEASPAPIE